LPRFDAPVLMMPIVGFLPADDPGVRPHGPSRAGFAMVLSDYQQCIAGLPRQRVE